MPAAEGAGTAQQDLRRRISAASITTASAVRPSPGERTPVVVERSSDRQPLGTQHVSTPGTQAVSTRRSGMRPGPADGPGPSGGRQTATPSGSGSRPAPVGPDQRAAPSDPGPGALVLFQRARPGVACSGATRGPTRGLQVLGPRPGIAWGRLSHVSTPTRAVSKRTAGGCAPSESVPRGTRAVSAPRAVGCVLMALGGRPTEPSRATSVPASGSQAKRVSACPGRPPDPPATRAFAPCSAKQPLHNVRQGSQAIRARAPWGSASVPAPGSPARVRPTGPSRRFSARDPASPGVACSTLVPRRARLARTRRSGARHPAESVPRGTQAVSPRSVPHSCNRAAVRLAP
jgi:hypothetical protein